MQHAGLDCEDTFDKLVGRIPLYGWLVELLCQQVSLHAQFSHNLEMSDVQNTPPLSVRRVPMNASE